MAKGCSVLLLVAITLLYRPGSMARFTQCANEFGPSTKEFAECWRGEKVLRTELCQYAAKQLGNPWLNDWQKRVIYEAMKHRNCM